MTATIPASKKEYPYKPLKQESLYAASSFNILKMNVSNDEPAQSKKEIHAEVPVFKKEYWIVEIDTGIYAGMIKQNSNGGKTSEYLYKSEWMVHYR
jgi:hypothetical protein